jgi:hypothetical protein
MANYLIPNSYQTPNALVDLIMPFLTSEEWRVLSFAVRHILGFDDHRASRRRRLSISTFEQGYATFPGCGLKRAAIMTALDGLALYGVMRKIGKATTSGQEWEIPLDPKLIDLNGLEARIAAQAKAASKRTAKARRAKMASQSVPQTSSGLSDRPVDIKEAVCDTDQSQSVPQTSSGLSDRQNQTDSQTHLQTDSTRRYRAEATASSAFPVPAGYWRALRLRLALPYLVLALKVEIDTEQTQADKQIATNKAIAAIIKAWLDASGVIKLKPYENKTIRGYAEALHEAGFTPTDVTQFIDDRLMEEFWQDKGITIEIVAKDIGRWKAAQDDGEDDEEAYEDDDSGEERIPMPDYIREQMLALRRQMSVNELPV